MRKPVYNREQDGPDVFRWILEASQVYRELKQQERKNAIEKAAAEFKGMDLPKMENKKWKAVNAR